MSHFKLRKLVLEYTNVLCYIINIRKKDIYKRAVFHLRKAGYLHRELALND